MNVTRVYYGQAGDIPVPGYYRGEAAKDIAVFRASTGFWGIRGVSRIYFGTGKALPVPETYGNGHDWQEAIFRGPTSLWAIRSLTRLYFGGSGGPGGPGRLYRNGEMQLRDLPGAERPLGDQKRHPDLFRSSRRHPFARAGSVLSHATSSAPDTPFTARARHSNPQSVSVTDTGLTSLNALHRE